MRERTENIIALCEEFMRLGAAQMGFESFTEMDQDEFKLFQIMMKLYEESKELMREQVKYQENVEKKLDTIVDMLKKQDYQLEMVKDGMNKPMKK